MLHKPPQRIERREKPGEMRKISVAHPNGSSDALRFVSVIRAVDVAPFFPHESLRRRRPRRSR
jgi:hypothetical protein